MGAARLAHPHHSTCKHFATRFQMTSKAGAGADLRKFMEKRLDLKLNANRHVVGVLRGYDQFMNIVLDNTVEIVSPTEKNEIGMVVIRGNSIMMWECLDRVK